MPNYVIVLYLISSVTLLLLGFLALNNNKGAVANKTLCAFSLSAVLWMLTLYLGFYWAKPETVHVSNIFFRLCFGFGFLMPFLLPIFFYQFTGSTLKIDKMFRGIFPLLGLFIFAIAAFTPYVYESVIVAENGELGDVLGKYYTPFMYSFLFFFLLALVIAIPKLFRAKEKIERKKLAISTWGSGVFMSLISMTNLVLPTFGILLFQLESGAFSLFFTIPAFYAIVRYRFLDIKLTLHRVLSVSTIALVYLLPILVFSGQLLASPFVAIIFYASLGLLYREIYSFVSAFWNYLLFGKATNEIQDIKNALQSFKFSLNEGLDQLTNALQVNGAQFLFAGEASALPMQKFFQESSTEDLVRDEIDYLARTNTKLRSDFKKIKKEMDRFMVAVAIPVWANDNTLIGVLLLEKRVDGHLFSSQEIAATKKVLKEAAYYIAHEADYKRNFSTDLKSGELFSSADFFNDFMHEIRHPLMVAQNMSQLFEWKKLNPDDQQHLQQSEEALTDMTRKLDAIAEAFQWKNKMMTLQKSYTTPSSFFDFLDKEFLDQKIEIKIQKKIKEVLFSVDVHHLKEAFVEILKNAFFFNKSKSPRVDIDVSKEKNKLSFLIKDNGSGVKKENWENVFDLLFVESFSRNKNECGLGVGLTKARGIIESHGGKCEIAKSSEKQGTVVLVEIPLLEKH